MSESQSPEAMAQEAKRLRVLISGLQAAQSRLFLKERIAHIDAAIRRLDDTIDALAALARAGNEIGTLGRIQRLAEKIQRIASEIDHYKTRHDILESSMAIAIDAKRLLLATQPKDNG